HMADEAVVAPDEPVRRIAIAELGERDQKPVIDLRFRVRAVSESCHEQILSVPAVSADSRKFAQWRTPPPAPKPSFLSFHQAEVKRYAGGTLSQLWILANPPRTALQEPVHERGGGGGHAQRLALPEQRQADQLVARARHARAQAAGLADEHEHDSATAVVGHVVRDGLRPTGARAG